MKRLSGAALAAVLLVSGCASTEHRPGASRATTGSGPSAERELDEMSWLAGTWSGAMWGGEFVAHYSAPVSGRVLSHSELLQDGNVAFYEFEVFRVVDGRVRLSPHPGGSPAGEFELSRHDSRARKAVFENREKDFPTRVTYYRPSADALVITLDDSTGKSDKVEVFRLARVR